MRSCLHLENFEFKAPGYSSKVFKDECTQCFDSAIDPAGVNVCISCFNGGCLQHSQKHFQLSAHPLVLNIRKVLKSKNGRFPRKDEHPPAAKVQIIEHSDSDIYDTVSTIHCIPCSSLLEGEKPDYFIAALLNATSAKQQSDIKAWEEEISACEHSLCIEQTTEIKRDIMSKCNDCDSNANLWLCLLCGNVGCGRRQFDGSGGNNHGINHFTSTGHTVACKLGTITAEGTGDVYCYKCDDLKFDPYLSQHLATFDILVSQQAKTEKSMAELQLEQNLKFEFNMVSDDGKDLEPAFGPGLTGIKNIGNSCYLASVLQGVSSTPLFSNDILSRHVNECKSWSPADCVQCQLSKMICGMNSGKYSKPSMRLKDSDQPMFQEGVSPAMFKSLVTKDNAEFSSARQQKDAYEFLQFLLDFLDKNDSSNPSKCFEALLSSRLECLECHKVGYTKEKSSGISIPLKYVTSEPDNETVNLSECISGYFESEIVEGFYCPSCSKKVNATKTMRFIGYPEFLTMQLRRFVLENWVPKKLNTKVAVNCEKLNLSPYEVTGEPIDGEELFPVDVLSQPHVPEYNEADVEQLMSMGFGKNRSIRALLETRNGVEAAMEWLFGKMEDPNLDDPLETRSKDELNVEMISSLVDMGFTIIQAKNALKTTKNNLEAAVEWLFNNPADVTSQEVPKETEEEKVRDWFPRHVPEYQLHAIIAHKGTSTQCGHYVAYVTHGNEWYLFNDEKVAKVGETIASVEGAANGYIYVYKSAK